MGTNSEIFERNAIFKLVSLTLFLLLVGASIVYADSPGALLAHIRKISIDVHDIYDLRKSEKLRFLYTWANKLHIETHDSVVRRELLFKEGDIYDPALIAESERILRSYPFFRSVTIRVSEPEDNMVDIIVETHDVWTTEIQVDWGSTAGQTNWLVGFKELNVLGQGQSVKTTYKKNLDEKIQTFSFKDPRFLNSHVNLQSYFDKGEKSESWNFQCNRPFFATIARWSAGFGMASHKENQELLTSGERTSSFDAYNRSAGAFTGYAFTASRDKRSALILSSVLDSTHFSNIAMSNDTAPPVDRAINGVILSYSFEKISFIKERHITKFDRDEDFYLGPQHVVSYGMFPKKLGSTDEEKLVEYYYSKGLPINSGQFALFNLYSKNQFREHLARTSKQAISTQYYQRIAKQHTIAAHMEFAKLINPDNDQELLLGDESGMRGYSVREFSGNKRLFFSIEDRLFLKDDLWKLFFVGGALFYDAGMVWREDEPVDLRGVKSDVGIGLRFGISRSSASEVIRVDLAYALNGNKEDTRWVLTIKSGQIFKPKEINDFRSEN